MITILVYLDKVSKKTLNVVISGFLIRFVPSRQVSKDVFTEEKETVHYVISCL